MTADDAAALAQRATPRPPKPTICKCGLAKSYHGGVYERDSDHEYEPRYPADAVALGWKAGREQAEAERDEALALLREIEGLWTRGFREASWGHGKACNIHTQEEPGKGCSCVFGPLHALITLRRHAAQPVAK